MTEVAEQGGLAGTYSPVPEAAAVALLRAHYGVDGILKRFETEKDDTFRVTTASNRKYVLKIANPDEPVEEIDFQSKILSHIEAIDPGLPIPHIVPNRAGQTMFEIVAGEVGAGRIVRVLTFIDGIPLSETTSSASERVQIGRMLGRLRLATEGFSHPAENRHYAWDVQHLLTLEHLLDEVRDSGQREALAAGLERFRAIEPDVRRLRQQVLHNDFSKSNIVVDHDNPAFVNGIIDFGDSVKTAIAIDVATACLNQLPEEPNEDLFWRARDIVDGYLQIADLTTDELRMVPHLTMARVVARALITLWRARAFPENERYIMRNTYQGWHQLDWFLARSPDEISDVFRDFI